MNGQSGLDWPGKRQLKTSALAHSESVARLTIKRFKNKKDDF